jgi:hypothetical protein
VHGVVATQEKCGHHDGTEVLTRAEGLRDPPGPFRNGLWQAREVHRAKDGDAFRSRPCSPRVHCRESSSLVLCVAGLVPGAHGCHHDQSAGSIRMMERKMDGWTRAAGDAAHKRCVHR